jgi:hypothetical protein
MIVQIDALVTDRTQGVLLLLVRGCTIKITKKKSKKLLLE